MFPIRDHNPSTGTPFVTWTLIAVNFAIFAAYFPLFQNPSALDSFFMRWALVPAYSSADPTSFLTSMFLHANLMHLAGNMLFLWIFGDNLEDEMGHLWFLAFYLAGGFGAGVAQVASSPGSMVPMVGASGAIAAVMGGYLLMHPRAKVDVLVILIVIFRIVSVPAWLMLGLWLGFQIYNGTATPAGDAGVAYWAHIGGFASGVVLTIPLWLRRGGVGYWRRTHGEPPHPAARYRRVPTSVPNVRRRR